MKLSAITLVLSLRAAVCRKQTRLRSRQVASHDGVLEDAPERMLEGLDIEDEDEDTDLFRVSVKYLNEQGKAKALDLADSEFYEFESDNIVVIEVDEDSLIDIEEDENIESVTFDEADWQEEGYLERHATEEEVRRLTGEEVPYGISLVQADQIVEGPSPVTVCIADTGVLKSHEDLGGTNLVGKNRVTANGKRVVWKRDRRGHGTHVAGTVAATIGNGIGVRGVGSIPVYITRALDDSGAATASDVRSAVEQCANSGAKVVSLSLSGSSLSDEFYDLFTRMYDQQGILIFAASGNDGSNVAKYPAAHPRVVSVGAVRKDSVLWPASNYGEWIELVAPGDMVLSTSVKYDSSRGYIPSYSYYSGTSMATPHAAGVAALIWSHHPKCTNSQIRYAMAYTALDLGQSGCDEKYGNGLIQAKAALDYLNSHPCDTWQAKSDQQGGCTVV